MAYNEMEDQPGAAEALSEGGGSGRDDTFFLPEDYEGDCKVGDIIKLRVLAVPEDGPPEVEVISEGSPKEKMGMMEDLRSSLSESEME